MPVSLVGLALLQVALGLAALVVLGPDVAVAADLEVQRLRKRVDDRDADAVEAAGDLVAAALPPNLPPAWSIGQDDLGRGALLLRVLVDRDAAAVVDDGDRLVRVDRDRDVVAVAGERLVDGVVDDLVDQVMEAARAGRADVHARPLAHRVEAPEDRDLARGVVGARLAAVLRRAFLPPRLLLSPLGPLVVAQGETPAAASPTTRRCCRRIGAHFQVHIRIPGRRGRNADHRVTKSLQISIKLRRRSTDHRHGRRRR